MKLKATVYVCKNINESLKSVRVIKILFREIYKIELKDDEILRDSYGKIYLKNYKQKLSVSHNHDLLAIAICEDIVGIDVEKVRNIDRYVLKKAFNSEEIKDIYNSQTPNKLFFSLWTLKECYVKAVGIGLSYGMKNVEFKISNNGIRSNMKEYYYKIYELYNNNILAICTNKNFEEVEVREVDISNEGVRYF